MRIYALACLLVGCRLTHPSPVAGDAGVDAGPKPAASATLDDAGPRFGLIRRTINILPGSGIGVSAVDNAATGQQDTTITNTSPGGGGVTSVTASGAGITASPTTGAVIVTNTAPMLANTVPNGLTGATSGNAHGVAIWEGTSPMVASATGPLGMPLIGQGASADPIFSPVDLTSGVTMLLPSGHGGTGSNGGGAHSFAIFEGSSTPMASVLCASGQVPMGVTSADPSCTTAGGDVVGPYNGLVVGGIQNRPVTNATPAVGATLQWNGSQWTPTGTAGTTAFAARASATVSALVDLNSATIQVGTGQKATFWIWFDFGPNTDGSTLSDDMKYGYGINSGSAFTGSESITIPPHQGVPGTGIASATLIGQTSTTGSVVVHALAQVTAGGAVANPVGAVILVMLTQ